VKKFFRKALCLGAIIGIAGLAGCLNPFDPPGEAPRGKGRVVVTINGAADRPSRTVAPDTDLVVKYTLSFTGPADLDPVDLIDGSAAVDLPAGPWTITATGYAGTEPAPVAAGSASLDVISGTNPPVNITLGPIPGGDPGTLSYSLKIPSGLDSAELIISPAEGEPLIIPLSYAYAGVNGSEALDPGEYLALVRLQDNGLYAGFAEALHIYSGLTSTLPYKQFTADDFKAAVDSDFDLTSLITAPAVWAEPVAAFAGEQYTGKVTWKAGAATVSGAFAGGVAYEALVALTAKPGYTFAGVPENSFTHSDAVQITNAADSNVVVISFRATASQSITGLAVSPDSVSVSRGWTRAFSAAVTGTGTSAPPQTVAWTLTGNSDEGTFIAEDGTLTIALNESSASLTIRAVSLLDPSYDDTALVAVTAAPLITITTAEELAKIGADPGYPPGGTYRLDAGLTLSDWTPIGDASAPFFGVFDGNSQTITLQSLDSAAVSGTPHLGIFGYVKGGSDTSKAELKDLRIVSSVNAVSAMDTGQALGLLAGYAERAEVSGIDIRGSLAFSTEKISFTGGIIGYAQKGTLMRDCVGSASLDAKGGVGSALAPGMAIFNYVGGLVGIFKDGVVIRNCRNTGNVSSFCAIADSQVYAGGIAGGSYYEMNTAYHGVIENCSYAGTVHAKAMGYWTWAGGIAGTIVGDGDGSLANTTRIVRCRAEGTVSVAGTSSGYPYVGGIVAYNYYGALITQSSFNGNVLADSGADYAGGIAGYNSRYEGHNSRIEDCWSAGTVTGFNNAGGIVGQNQAEAYVRRCYSTAAVEAAAAGSTGVGGIAGLNASVISACVALNPSIEAGNTGKIHRIAGDGDGAQNLNNRGWSGMTISTGGDYAPDTGANAKDGADCDMQPGQSFYEALGWDFATVWTMGGGGYPVLQ
jgi:hypothetical protein